MHLDGNLIQSVSLLDCKLPEGGDSVCLPLVLALDPSRASSMRVVPGKIQLGFRLGGVSCTGVQNLAPCQHKPDLFATLLSPFSQVFVPLSTLHLLYLPLSMIAVDRV